MKVLDLQCKHGHVFEGWFGSDADFQSQLASGLLTCPVCDDAHIHKKLSAPRLNLGARPPINQREAASKLSSSALQHPCAKGGQVTTPSSSRAKGLDTSGHGQMDAVADMRSMLRQAVSHFLAQTQDVGEDFASHALQMHRGDAPLQAIRGQASQEEVRELLEEGVPVLPIPDVLLDDGSMPTSSKHKLPKRKLQ